MFYPQRVMRQISEISYVGGFKLIRMPNHQGGEPGIEIPLQYNDAHWRNIFNRFDSDGDGKISYQELRTMIRLSEYSHDIPDRVVQRIMHKADLDASGYLSYEEFIAMIHRKDMQGVFGHLVQRYVHSMIPQRPCSVQRRDYTDGQYEEEYSCKPPPLAMIIISMLEIILFMYDAIAHKSLSVDGPAAQLFVYDPHKRYQAWRYLTYMFVHVDYPHLVMNLLVQIMLGIPLEMVHKWWRVLIIYIAGVVAGSLGTSVSTPKVLLAGASGGVYALITAHVATILMNWSQMEFAVLQLLVFLVVTALDVAQAIYNHYTLGINDRVGYVAHLAGAIAGLLVGINVLRNLEEQTWEKVVWWTSIIVYVALMSAAILWNILNTSYYE
ncbi:rhomboid-related protein 3 isoform X1 [Hylaeus volcanicus]|uniref:rhomboid-related protein 3 isoform X1 n=2 Tax=Hylaeus volcanicus TaxID=313075 RepID=UPI0023B81449|nr:rhomboid-related protein 3 isoform X1 [Hylaeus volcanicus]